MNVGLSTVQNVSSLIIIRLNGRPQETREHSRGIQIPLDLLEGLRNTFSALGDISGRMIGIQY